MLEIRKFGVSNGNGVAHRNCPVAAIEGEDAAALADHDRDVALLARLTSGLIHFTNFGSGLTAVRSSVRSCV